MPTCYLVEEQVDREYKINVIMETNAKQPIKMAVKYEH